MVYFEKFKKCEDKYKRPDSKFCTIYTVETSGRGLWSYAMAIECLNFRKLKKGRKIYDNFKMTI